MSKKGDFLTGFSGGNTQKPLTEQNTTPVKENNPTEKEVKKETPSKVNAKVTAGKTDVTENKKIADKIVAEAEKKGATPKPASKSATSGTATRPAQSANAIIKAPEHVVTKDNTFHKRQMMKYGIFGGVAIILAVIAFLIFQMSTRFEVPNFVNRNPQDLMGWQLQNNPFNEEFAYSLEVDEGLIMAQSHEAGTTVSGGTIITVTISLGPDMNEVIALPEFEGMTRAQIRTWADENRMRSVNFNEENNADIEANHVIRVQFPPASDPANFRRSDSVNIIVSTGPETIQIGNLVGNDSEAIEKFIEENPLVNVEFEYEPHSTIVRGNVLRQSIREGDELRAVNPGSRIPAGETLILTLSAGNPVTVPNFSGIRRAEAEDMMEDPNLEGELDVVVVRRFNDTIPYGRFVSQSVEAGEELYAADRTVTVVYSEGRPWIPAFGTEDEVEPAIVALNDDGAFLTVRFNRVNSYAPRGTILRQSHHGQRVSLTQEIVFDVSLQNLQPPADALPPDQGPGDQGGPEEDDPN